MSAPALRQLAPQLHAGLSEAALMFLRESSVDRGPSLEAQVIIALGQRDRRPQGELLAALEGQVPAELAPAGSNGRRALLLMALAELEVRRLIDRPGRRDEDVVRLAPAPPDDRFERDELLRLLLPHPAPGAVAALERKLVCEGCRQDLLLWQETGSDRPLPLLADGYYRDELFRRHGMTFTVALVPGLADRRALESWRWQDHAGRRSLLPVAQGYARGRWFNGIKAGRGGDRRPGRSRRPTTEVAHAAEVVARADQVTSRTVYADGRFAEALDTIGAACGPELAAALLGGRIRFGRPDVLLLAQRPEAEMRRLTAALLAGEKVRLRPASPRRQLVLPLDDLERQAQLLLHGLGGPHIDLLFHKIAVLRRQAKEQAG